MTDYSTWSPRELIEELAIVDENSGFSSDWEMDFYSSLKERLKDWGEETLLTRRQRAKCVEILERFYRWPITESER